MGQINFLEHNPVIRLRFQNLTSETRVSESMQMTSISSDGCVLILPKSSCSLNHQILLTLTVEIKNHKKRKIEIVGKVIELNPINEVSSETRIVFGQFLKEEWQYLLSLYEQKQKQISEVVETLKTPKV